MYEADAAEEFADDVELLDDHEMAYDLADDVDLIEDYEDLDGEYEPFDPELEYDDDGYDDGMAELAPWEGYEPFVDDAERRYRRRYSRRTGSYMLARQRQRRLAALRRRRTAAARARARARVVRAQASRRTASSQARQASVQAKEASLKTDVLKDASRKALKDQSGRISRTESSLALHAVTSQLQESFPEWFENDLVKTLVPLGSLAVLNPPKGKGVGGFLGDPRVFGPGLSLLIAGIKKYQDDRDPRGVDAMAIKGTPFIEVGANQQQAVALEVLTGKGIPAKDQSLQYMVMDTATATVDATGLVKGVKAGETELLAADATGTVVKTIKIRVG